MAEYRLVVLGGGGVGKSCLTLQLVNHTFQTYYDPTIEDSYRKQVEVDNTIAILHIIDTAGQEEFAAMREQYIRQGQGFLLVYSITNRATYNEIADIRSQVGRVKAGEGIEKVPAVLVGNKCDLEDSREVSTDEGAALAKKLGCPFFEASAKDNINTEESFFGVVREIRRLSQTNTAKAGGGLKKSMTTATTRRKACVLW